MTELSNHIYGFLILWVFISFTLVRGDVDEPTLFATIAWSLALGFLGSLMFMFVFEFFAWAIWGLHTAITGGC